MSSSSNALKVMIIWDMQSCPVPVDAADVFTKIINATKNLGSYMDGVIQFLAFGTSEDCLKYNKNGGEIENLNKTAGVKIQIQQGDAMDIVCKAMFMIKSAKASTIILISSNVYAGKALLTVSSHGYKTVWIAKRNHYNECLYDSHIMMTMEWDNFFAGKAGTVHVDSIFASTGAPVLVLWDIKNCPIPTNRSARNVGYHVYKALSTKVNIGPGSKIIAYENLINKDEENRRALSDTGVKLSYIPNKNQEAVDKAILTEIISFTDNYRKPAALILVTGNNDFALALNTVNEMSDYTVGLIYPDGQVNDVLLKTTNLQWKWSEIFS